MFCRNLIGLRIVSDYFIFSVCINSINLGEERERCSSRGILNKLMK